MILNRLKEGFLQFLQISELIQIEELKRSNILPSFTKQLSMTLVRHFDAYRFVFTQQRDLLEKSELISVTTPIQTVPLHKFTDV